MSKNLTLEEIKTIKAVRENVIKEHQIIKK